MPLPNTTNDNDEIVLTPADLADFTTLDGMGGQDTLTLTQPYELYDLTTKTIIGFEILKGSPFATPVTMTTEQYANFETIINIGLIEVVGNGGQFNLGDGHIQSAATYFKSTQGNDRVIISSAKLSSFYGFEGNFGDDTLALDGPGVYDFSNAGMNDFEVLEASNGDDTIRLSGLSFTSFHTINGGDGTDTIALFEASPYPVLLGGIQGFSLNSVERIIGSAESDTFAVGPGGLGDITSLEGGDGIDTLGIVLDLSAPQGSGLIGGTLDLAALDTFEDIEVVQGSGGDDRIIIKAAMLGTTDFHADPNNTALADGPGNADVLELGEADVYDFSGATVDGFEILRGSDGTDDIKGALGAGFTTIDGGLGEDTLRLDEPEAVFNATDGVKLSNVETIVGTAGSDNLAFGSEGIADGQSLLGAIKSIDGGDGSNVLKIAQPAAGTTGCFLDLASLDTFANFDVLIGSEQDDTVRMTAAQFSQTLNVMQGKGGTDTLILANGGTYNFVTKNFFDGFEKLQGSGESDTLIANLSTFNGFDTIDGGAGDDVLQVDGGVLNFLDAPVLTSIERLVLSGNGDQLGATSNDLAAFKTVDGGGGIDTLSLMAAGTFDTTVTDIRNFESLYGTGIGDTFLGTAETLSRFAIFNGGGGTDRVELKEAGTFVLKQTFDSIEELVGSGGDDRIVAGQASFGQIGTIKGGDGFDTLALAIGSETTIDLDDLNIAEFERIELLAPLGNSIVGSNLGRALLVDASVGVSDTFSWTGATPLTSQQRNALFARGFETVVSGGINYTNEAPDNLALDGTLAVENAAAGTVVGQLSATDAPGQALTFTLTQNPGGLFAVDAQNRLVVAPGAKIDYEALGPDRTVTVKVRVSDGSKFTEKSFTLAVGDVDEAPTAIALDGTTVEENAAAGTVVGTLSAVDPEGTAVTFSLKNPNSPFEIVENELRVKDPARIDHEYTDLFPVTVTATDATGKSVDQLFLVSIADVNEKPTRITLSSSAVDELEKGDALVGTLSGADPDMDALTFSFAPGGDAGGRFKIVGNEIRVAAGTLLDYEQKAQHTVTVIADDGKGGLFEQTLTIAVRDVNPETANGTAGADVFVGGAGADTLKGFAGTDTLTGGAGNDRLQGGEGVDILRGGTGKDVFVFDTAPVKGAADKILDFNVKDDTLWLSKTAFGKLAKGPLKADFFTIGTKAADKNDYLIYNKSTGALFYDADGSATKFAAIQIATLSKSLAMSAADFLVI